MNFSTAESMFLRQDVREQGLSFRPMRGAPNAKTLAPMRKADRITTNPNA